MSLLFSDSLPPFLHVTGVVLFFVTFSRKFGFFSVWIFLCFVRQDEAAARAAQLLALTRRRDALLTRTTRDDRNAAKLSNAAAKQRALGDVGEATLKALSTCMGTVDKARVELGQQKARTEVCLKVEVK